MVTHGRSPVLSCASAVRPVSRAAGHCASESRGFSLSVSVLRPRAVSPADLRVRAGGGGSSVLARSSCGPGVLRSLGCLTVGLSLAVRAGVSEPVGQCPPESPPQTAARASEHLDSHLGPGGPRLPECGEQAGRQPGACGSLREGTGLQPIFPDSASRGPRGLSASPQHAGSHRSGGHCQTVSSVLRRRIVGSRPP